MFTFFSDIVESNGKTIGENNLAKMHNIPLGSVVKLSFKNNFGVCLGTPDEIDLEFEGTCMAVVVEHTRDCDGTPLYNLATSSIIPPSNKRDMPLYNYLARQFFSGYGEDRLIPIGKIIPLRTFSEAIDSFYRI